MTTAPAPDADLEGWVGQRVAYRRAVSRFGGWRVGWVVAALAAAKAVVTLATDNRYGFHRDELYYVVSGRRLGWGYVDFPPVTPVLARAAHAVFGGSLVGLRSLALAAGLVTLWLTVAMTKRLGGSRWAQVLAAVAVVTCTFYLGANGLFQTVSFDIAAWALGLYMFVRLFTSGDPRWWLGVGAAVGIGMETKYTMPAFVAGLAVATLLTPMRRDLRSKWPWLGAGVAAMIAAPNLVWQVTNGWPSLEFLRGQNARVRSEYAAPRYVIEQLITVGPALLILGAAGLVRAWRNPRWRPLFWMVVTVEVVYLAARGKSYYPLDVLPLAIASGAVAVSGWTRRTTLAIGLVAWCVVGLPLALPVLPQSTMLSLGLDKARDDFSAELGWPAIVKQIADVYDTLPADQQSATFVLTRNYSQAAAIDIYGGPYHLPAAHSGHNSYWLWLPDHPPLGTILAIGFPESTLRQWFADVTTVGQLPPSRDIDVDERGAPIAICHQPLVTPTQLRDDVKLYT